MSLIFFYCFINPYANPNANPNQHKCLVQSMQIYVDICFQQTTKEYLY